MLIGGKINVPDKCGDFCNFHKSDIIPDTNPPCFRCPILNCHDIPEIGGPLVDPIDFNVNIAQEYVNWWGESNLPEIKDS